MKPRNDSKRYGQAFSFKKKLGRGLQKGNRKKPVKLRKGQIVDSEIAELEQKIQAGIDVSKVETFSDFPLSKCTMAGLKSGKYTTPTDIQKQAIGAALQGRDVLGAAKTGSGKTLAFLIPVLEVLYKAKMSASYGMAALIITPTRELAFQIFEVLNKIRSHHDFTANLIIGGKHMSREEKLMSNTNIVICTPGRLLHHLDQTQRFNADELRILVLDEADRIMDSTFAHQIDSIISHLPADRQTLMFSATQTKSVKKLARLRLNDPTYISVHENAQYSTPSGLMQTYVVCELHEKIAFLFSFLEEHRKNKILVFLQTCKQVRYVYSLVRYMDSMKRAGFRSSVLQLNGGMNQLKRIDVYREFCQKQTVVLFATDIACRGLDFPGVNWVVQLDCPVDAATYIHRAGRTARFQRNGQAVLVLLPSEEEHMVQALQAKKIPISKMRVRKKFHQNMQHGPLTGNIAAACVADQTLKEKAGRAVRDYFFSLLRSKTASDVTKLDPQLFAESLGLVKAPKLRFLEKYLKAKAKKEQAGDQKTLPPYSKKTASKDSEDSSDDEDETSDDSSSESDSGSDSTDSDESDSDSDTSDSDSGSDSSENSDSEDERKNGTQAKTAKRDKENAVKESNSVVKGVQSKPNFDFSSSDGDDDAEDLFTVKRTLQPLLEQTTDETPEVTTSKKSSTKTALAKRILKKGTTANIRLTFDDDGNVIHDARKRQLAVDEEEEEDDGGLNIPSAVKRLRMEDQVDKQLDRERVKQKHREERIKKKEKKRAEKGQKKTEEEEGEEEAVLSGVDEDDDPFKYIPDPDELAAREKQESEDGDSDADGSDSNDDDEADDNDDHSDDDDDDDDDNDDDEDDSGSDSEEERQEKRSSLEETALLLLQGNRKK